MQLLRALAKANTSDDLECARGVLRELLRLYAPLCGGPGGGGGKDEGTDEGDGGDSPTVSDALSRMDIRQLLKDTKANASVAPMMRVLKKDLKRRRSKGAPEVQPQPAGRNEAHELMQLWKRSI